MVRFNSWDLGNEEFPSMAINPWSILNRSSRTFYGPIYGSNRNVYSFNTSKPFNCEEMIGIKLITWLVGFLWHINLCRLFNAKSIFFTNIQLCFKQWSSAWIYSLLSKKLLFQVIQLFQTILIQAIHFSKSIDFVYTQLNVKKLLSQTIQFSVSTLSMSRTVPLQTVQFRMRTQFKYQNSSIWNNSV